ncbi:MAG TPA: nicotinamidase [Anaeromyxobacter sp.]|nr:nicotinamidase [Anaeromyxobacter sp.]
MRIERARDALVVVDVQHDFLPGGALAVADGDAVVAPIAALAPAFATVVATQDWHPPGHVSFASAHPGRRPFETVALPQGPQELWPDHCVAGSRGAALHPALPDAALTLILRKGTRREVDSYSAFRENVGPDGGRPTTGLGAWLAARGVARVFVCGLARDFCVRATAVDGAGEGLEVIVLDDLTRAVFPDRRGECDAALAAAGVRLSDSRTIER